MPSQHDVVANRQNSPFEHGAHIVGQPEVRNRPLLQIGYALDTVPDFGERDHADKQGLERPRLFLPRRRPLRDPRQLGIIGKSRRLTGMRVRQIRPSLLVERVDQGP